jgi:hypothetical protein
MKQQDTNLHPQSSFRAKARDLIQRAILALGLSALIALATGAHADFLPPQDISMNLSLNSSE